MAYTKDQIDAIEDEEEKEKIAKKCNRENDLLKQKYGEC